MDLLLHVLYGKVHITHCMELVFALCKDGMYHPLMDKVEAPNSISDPNYDTNLLQSGQLLTST